MHWNIYIILSITLGLDIFTVFFFFPQLNSNIEPNVSFGEMLTHKNVYIVMFKKQIIKQRAMYWQNILIIIFLFYDLLCRYTQIKENFENYSKIFNIM